MKLIILGLFLLSSLPALAARDITVELVAEQGIAFRAYKYASGSYMAANPTCQEMQPTHVLPIPVRKEKQGNINLSDDALSITSSLGGLCAYKLYRMTTRLERNDGKTMILELYPNAKGPAEIDLVCTRSGDFLCREKGKLTFNLPLSVSSKETTKINVTIE